MRSSSRVGTLLLALAAIVVGGTFLVVGLALLAGIAIAGVLMGTAALLYRRLTGRTPGFGRRATRDRVQLPPELEVFSPGQANDRHLHR